MKTTNTILISGAHGEFKSVSGLDGNAEANKTVVLQHVVFQDQTDLWMGYEMPIQREGTVVIEQKNEKGDPIKTWTLINAHATKFSTGTPPDGAGPTFESIELTYEDLEVEVH